MNHLPTFRAYLVRILMGVVGATAMPACGANDAGSVGPGGDSSEPTAEAALESKGPIAPDKRISEGSSPALPQEPLECGDTIKQAPCMKYRTPLLGNPSTDPVLRAKYKAAFGSACYMSAANAFNCFYKKELMTPKGTACKDAQMIAKVYGADPYSPNFDCEEVGNGTKDWFLQVGPDSANKIYITFEKAPLESELIDVNGVPTAINGPYRNLPEPSKVEPGRPFDCFIDGVPQRQFYLQVNRKKHSGKIHSDLAGFSWYCNEKDNPICYEETVLQEPTASHYNAARVHHVARKTDLRGCDWGTNSNKNAVVISRKLNGYLYNKYPEAKEVNAVNTSPPYTP